MKDRHHLFWVCAGADGEDVWAVESEEGGGRVRAVFFGPRAEARATRYMDLMNWFEDQLLPWSDSYLQELMGKGH